ncbi:MAG: hypothetical protein MJ147_09365 [Clostridia bacterium]|nr:hypothetical protein [Clostridia bacterium]
MSINDAKILKWVGKYPSAFDCRMKLKSPLDALPCYEYLESIRTQIPNELYAYNLRSLLEFNTANVPVEMRLRMLKDVTWNEIMYQDELDAISRFDSQITIYRGTNSSEKKPGISWTLQKSIAYSEPFNRGRVFKATISKESIIAYFAHKENEEEIIANVNSEYSIVYDE